MQLDGARTVVLGAGGALGAGLTRELVARGATVVPGGRDPGRLADLVEATGQDAVVFDAVDPASCRAAVDEAADRLGGLDLVVVATGVAAFGPAVEADDAIVEELFSVNVLGPMAMAAAGVPHVADGGAVVVLSAILADLPTNNMAAYSATKAALSSWLEVLRREQRRRIAVLDVRPPHLDTGLQTRALAGEPPSLPEPYPAAEVVTAILAAVEQDARTLTWDPKAKALVAG